MDLVLNTKFFSELAPPQLGETARALGYDGVDICVRPGHPIHLDNAQTALPEASAVWRDQGVVCPLATAPVSFTDPAVAEPLYEACARAGIPRVKLGYWRFADGDDYWEVLDRARGDLEGFAALSGQYGVISCCHTHSGSCLGSNCAGVMHLVKGFDPQLVGVYPDFGHMALDGEDAQMGLSMVRQHLTIVAIKDGYHKRRSTGEAPPHVPAFAPVGQGSVDWRRALGLLVDMGYDGALAVHTEYEFEEAIIRQVGYADSAPPDLEATAREDAVYLRDILTTSNES